MSSRVSQLLEQLARELSEQMRDCGCNPSDPTDVDRFINGVSVSKKLKALISEVMDDE